jgi:hypothetical protein
MGRTGADGPSVMQFWRIFINSQARQLESQHLIEPRQGVELERVEALGLWKLRRAGNGFK